MAVEITSRERLFGSTSLLVIFDGDCGLCSRFAAWLGRQDRAGRLRILPSQTPGLLAGSGVTKQEAASSVWAMEQTGTRHAGAAAIHRMLRELDGPFWPAFTLLSLVPGVPWLEAHVYAWVAHYRAHLAWPAPHARCGAPGTER